jgi:hypothetical protein
MPWLPRYRSQLWEAVQEQAEHHAGTLLEAESMTKLSRQELVAQARRCADGLQAALQSLAGVAAAGEADPDPPLIGLHGGPSLDHLAMMLAVLSCG